ncbi:MAG TPA: GatB/YqeY domain-containing protein [Candidatus Paceibacterota bacterium]|nr:GatB/YqeY domain-containing protein [Candidatus Paceibacterota bacterium]
MTLKETIQADMKAAFKAGDQTTRGTLSLLLSVIQNRELAKRAKTGVPAELTEEEVVEAVSSEIKKRKESIATYEAGGRPELAASESAELAVLQKYMPAQISEDEVRKLIADALAATGASGAAGIGKVMGKIAPAIKGKFDGARANALVKEALGA